MKRTNGWAAHFSWRGRGRPRRRWPPSLRDFAHVVQATGNALNEAETFQLFSSWTGRQGQTPRSTPLVALDVVDDLAACQPEYNMGLAVGHERGDRRARRRRFAPMNRRSRAASSATGTTRRSGARCRRRRRATRTAPRRQAPASRPGGGTDEAEPRRASRRPLRGGAAHRRQPAQGEEFQHVVRRGGIFGAGPPLRAPRHKTQSNASSVRGGIFAASSRPGTAEYGRYVEPKRTVGL